MAWWRLIRAVVGAVLLCGVACSRDRLVADEAGSRPAGQAAPSPAWVALWQDAYPGPGEPALDPEKMSVTVFVDRTTGDAFISGWNFGVRKSRDGGRTFSRVDGGKISGPACGPFMGHSGYVSPEGGKIAVFNMWNSEGPSGYSLDGGATWESFAHCGRDWDFGAMDWASGTVLGARHEHDGLHLSLDAGKTWTQLERTRSNPWLTGLGVADPKAMLIATTNRIERSEDGGKTWAKVSDLGGWGPALAFKGKLWWLSGGAKKSIIVSADQGKTWAVCGEPLPAKLLEVGRPGAAGDSSAFGPLFGKDENHIVLATNVGFCETTDGCRDWKLVAPLPDSYTIGGWGNSAAFDHVHDVFYIANRSKPVMKFARSSPPEYVLPAWPTDTGVPDHRTELVEVTSPKIRVLNVFGLDLSGGFVHVGTEDGLIRFKQDPPTGKLSLAEGPNEARCGGFSIRCAAGRLYAVTPHDGYRRMTWHGLAWYDLDPQTGKPTKKGVVDCPAARQIVAGPEGKDLYLKACGGEQDKLFWYRLGAEGKPVKAGEVSGKGIGASTNNAHPCILQMAPDGRHLYAVSARDYAIACIERQPGGEIAYKGSTDLEAVAPRLPAQASSAAAEKPASTRPADRAGASDRYQWVSLALSPDGRWLYAGVRNGKPTENYYGIFRRDPRTGALTFQERFSGTKDRLANLRAWSMVFAGDGVGGWLGSLADPIVSFSYDARTGRLSNARVVKETQGHGAPYLLFDAPHGFLYSGGGDYGIVGYGLVVLKVDKP
jgi:photosystem II stability/assembly factor-like uncharacterized protein